MLSFKNASNFHNPVLTQKGYDISYSILLTLIIVYQLEMTPVYWFTRIIDMLIYDNQMFSTVTNRRWLIPFGTASWKAKVVLELPG